MPRSFYKMSGAYHADRMKLNRELREILSKILKKYLKKGYPLEDTAMAIIDEVRYSCTDIRLRHLLK